VHRVRVDERDLETEEAGARPVVDQLRAGVGQLRERCVEIADLVRDVVHPRSAARKKAADRGVVAEGLEELDAAGADLQRGRPDSLLLDRGAMLDLGAEQTAVRRHSGVEIVDGDTEMVDPLRRHRRIVAARQGLPRTSGLLSLDARAT
jgi:hypothetical protein